MPDSVLPPRIAPQLVRVGHGVVPVTQYTHILALTDTTQIEQVTLANVFQSFLKYSLGTNA